LISDSPPRAHFTQTLLVLERKLLVANEILLDNVAAATGDTADVGESGEFARVALESFRAVGSW